MPARAGVPGLAARPRPHLRRACRAGERCLIVTDTGADQSIVEALETVLGALGAPVGTASSPPVDLPGDSPPDAVGRAMLGADVVFELTSVFAGASRARREACARGARYLTVPGLTWETLRPGRAVLRGLRGARRGTRAASASASTRRRSSA